MSQDLIQHLSRVWTRATDLVADRAEGVYLYAADGQRYLDFSSGIGVTNTGHNHPRVVAAAKDQISRQLFEQLLAEEEEHLDFFENTAEHIEKLGAAYLATLLG